MVLRSRGKVFAAAGILGVVLLVKLSGKGLRWPSDGDVYATLNVNYGENRPRMAPVPAIQPAPACPKLPPPVAAASPKWQGSGKVAVHYQDGQQDPALAPLAAYSLGNALALLPGDWAVKFHTHHPLPAKITQRFKDDLASGRLEHVNLKEASGGSRANYLRGKAWAYTDPAWWGLIDAEHVLMLHPTAVLCSGADHTIGDFLQWDWIGAPWRWAQPKQPFFHGGNGAFSLRRKSAMLRLLSQETYEGKGNEDMWFVDRMVKANEKGGAFKLNDRTEGAKFAVEEMFYEAPLGISYAIRTVRDTQRNQIIANCPEARALVGYLPGADWLIKPEECKGVTDADPRPPCPWPDVDQPPRGAGHGGKNE